MMMMDKRSLSVVVLCLFLMVGMSWEVGAFDKEHIKKLKALGSCSSCDLSNANLSGADMTNANLTRAYLSKAIFCDTTMSDGTINNSGC